MNSIYEATVEDYPGFIWVVMVGYLILAQGCLYWTYQCMKVEKGWKEKENAALLLLEEEEEEEEVDEERMAGVVSGDST